MRVIFYYPSRVLGGVEVLFSAYALFLIEKGVNVFFYDFSDGFFSKKFDGVNGINFIKPNETWPDDSVVVSTPNLINSLKNNLSLIPKNNKLVIWHVQPWNGVPRLGPITQYYRVNYLLTNMLKRNDLLSWRKFIKLAIDKKSYFFMDEPCCKAVDYFMGGIDKGSSYLPIPVKVKNERLLSSSNQQKRQFNFAWLGRIDLDLKYHILNKVLHDFKRFSSGDLKPLKFTVIGTGPGEEKLKRTFESEKIQFIGSVPNSEIDNYLYNNVSLLFAMGTSALHGSALRIPTVCLDFSYKPISEYLYSFMFDRKEYSLGGQIGFTDQKGDYSFEDIISLRADELNKIGEKCYEYVFLNHNFETLKESFYMKIFSAELTFNELIL